MRPFLLLSLTSLLLLTACATNTETSPDATVTSEFRQNDQNGKSVALSDFRGNVVLVEFWATWCPPCRAHMPWVKELGNTFDQDDFTIIGVSLDYDLDAWRSYIVENNLDWVHVSDGNYWNNSVARQFDVRSTPTFMIFDRKGNRVGDTWRFNEIEAQIRTLLEAPE